MIEERQPKTLLEAYNEGIGDGLVYATAVLCRADHDRRKLLDEVIAKRRMLEREGEK